MASEPSVLVRGEVGGLTFDPHVLLPGHDRIVAERLREVLSAE